MGKRIVVLFLLFLNSCLTSQVIVGYGKSEREAMMMINHAATILNCEPIIKQSVQESSGILVIADCDKKWL